MRRGENEPVQFGSQLVERHIQTLNDGSIQHRDRPLRIIEPNRDDTPGGAGVVSLDS
jgi:hypothetical protein